MLTVQIVTWNITQFNVQKSQQYINKHKPDLKSVIRLKDSWGSYSATGSEITEKEQLLCNTYLNRICYMITSFHQPGTGR